MSKPKYVVVKESHFYPGSVGAPAPRALARGEDDKVITFDSKEAAEEFVSSLNSGLGGAQLLRSGEYARPDLVVREAGELLDEEEEAVFQDQEDCYSASEQWLPLAQAVAQALRFDPDNNFGECRDDGIEGPSAFGLQVFAPYSQVLVDLAEALGLEWWEYLDFSPRYCWVEGEFEEPEDLFNLADLLNWLSPRRDLIDDLDLSSLPTFGGEEPEDTQEVFSWDEDLLLVQGPSGFEVVTREEWADE